MGGALEDAENRADEFREYYDDKIKDDDDNDD